MDQAKVIPNCRPNVGDAADWAPQVNRLALRDTAAPKQLEPPFGRNHGGGVGAIVNGPQIAGMNIDLSDDAALLLRELDGVIDGDRYFLSAPHPHLEGDPRLDSALSGAGAAAAVEALRAAAGWARAATRAT
jgi:hypothetical protein